MNEAISPSVPTARSCPACGSLDSVWAFVARGFPHVRCRGCATLFVSPLPAAEVVQGVYLHPDYHHTAEASADRMLGEARGRAKILREYGCNRVLEVGCGMGYFLESAAELGMQAEGVDPGATGERAVARGLHVHRCFIEEFEPTGRYDAVAMFELLEHLPDPVRALTRVHDWIAPGGILALSTPSCTGIPARVLERRFPMICPPDHLELFSHRGLGMLLSRGGFRPIRWTSFSGLTRADLHRNFKRFFLGQSPVVDPLAGLLAWLSEIPLGMIDRGRLGTSFEVYAEREG